MPYIPAVATDMGRFVVRKTVSVVGVAHAFDAEITVAAINGTGHAACDPAPQEMVKKLGSPTSRPLMGAILTFRDNVPTIKSS